MRTRSILPILLLILTALSSMAQNVSFNQFDQSPFTTNPSILGMKNEASVSFLHRTQQLAADIKFNTTQLTGSYALINKKTFRRRGGVGFSILRDAQNGEQAFKLQGINLGYAYNLPFASNQFVSFGLQTGYFQRSINSDGYTTGSQWVNNIGFDRNAPLGETFLDNQTSYFSIASGATWYAEDASQRQIFRLGVGVAHLNKPDIAFTEVEDRLDYRLTGNAFIALLKNEKVLYGPELLYLYEANDDLISAGSSLSYFFKNDNPLSAIRSGSIDFKSRYTINNSIVLGIQLTQPNFSVGFSYDFAVGNNAVLTTGRNSSEIFISIKKSLGNRKQSNKVVIDNYSLGEVRDFYASDKVRYFGNENNAQPSDDAERQDEEEINWEEENYQFELRKDFSFGFNEANLSEEAKFFLDDIIRLLNSNDRLYLEVIGHTDNVGTNAANKKVSVARAQVVVDYLVEKGIRSKRLKVTGKGADEPLLDNSSESNRAQNRRVEFIIYTK
ncbi:PorP/SprF family type IX secretion system membrane protein [Fulvivirga lutea]|uniref:PorP/SprF family type IX secretion system membrane protein n=1 Tax=Fulvivirga lutea TaxID=2810512 RepID=A0A974WM09_9BACT|nr:PorP/SprF family type IX secretion system membrane protein [Fulvivirga lutea]QSE98720.1 PorP/SprF family type IX secretion system membrane protein [Fulvivirga lutea]